MSGIGKESRYYRKGGYYDSQENEIFFPFHFSHFTLEWEEKEAREREGEKLFNPFQCLSVKYSLIL